MARYSESEFQYLLSRVSDVVVVVADGEYCIKLRHGKSYFTHPLFPEVKITFTFPHRRYYLTHSLSSSTASVLLRLA